MENTKASIRVILLPLTFVALVFSGLLFYAMMSCEKLSVEHLKAEDLFTLEIGKMENQLDLFKNNTNSKLVSNHIYMKDGRIYLINGNSLKLMEFTVYGDLKSLIYNQEVNPKPAMLIEEEDGKIANRYAHPFAFVNLGNMGVDSKKNLYVTDEVPAEYYEVDEDKNFTKLYQRILRFDADGKLKDFFGQEGVGGRGTSFSYIDDIKITVKDELVVVTKSNNADWTVYWYSADGLKLYEITINAGNLPPLPQSVPQLVKIVPSYTDYKLYLYIYYYKDIINRETHLSEIITLDEARLCTLDVITGGFTTYINAPKIGLRKEIIGNIEQDIPASPFEFLGTTIHGFYYFIRPEDINQYKLIILDEKGREAAQRFLTINSADLYYKHIQLNNKGILAGLLCYQDHINIVWWRSDLLLKERIEKDQR